MNKQLCGFSIKEKLWTRNCFPEHCAKWTVLSTALP